MNLLSKAKKVRNKDRKYSSQEIEVALAWFRGEVSIYQAARVLGIKFL